MPQFNFGQQINQALGSAYDRMERATVRAQQIQERMRQRELEQQVQQAQQVFRQQQLLNQERQITADIQAQRATEQFREDQLAIDREQLQAQKTQQQNLSEHRSNQFQLDQSRVNKLNKLTDAKITQLEEATSGEGQDFSNKRLVDLINESNSAISLLQDNVNSLKGEKQIAQDATVEWYDFDGPDQTPEIAQIDSTISSQESRIQRLNRLIDAASGQLEENLIGDPDSGSGSDTPGGGGEITDELVQQYAQENGLTAAQARRELQAAIENQ